MKKSTARDTHATYQIDSEDDILRSAATILERRMMRLGSVSDPSAAKDFLRMRLAPLEHEVFSCLFLDTRHKIIAYEELFRGTIDASEVHPREVCKAALKHNAAAVLFAHNHPSSGSLEPSAADRAVTARLKQALSLLDIRTLDHIIVSCEGTTSMAERGLL